jgi:two-component system copper resistance phosphate regulon response regulator CusR
MRALVVEDGESIASLHRRLLEREGVEVDVAFTAADGARLVRANEYAVIVLDMILPDGHGMDLLKIIRERSKTIPVLIVSGQDDIDATVGALDAGADDYLHKPYQAMELAARVRVLIRRSQLLDSPLLHCGNITLHRLDRRATVGDQELKLTGKEFALLEYFILNQGKVIARADLLTSVWRVDFDPGTNIVDVNVSRLRVKLVDADATCHLDAERGVGYICVVA